MNAKSRNMVLLDFIEAMDEANGLDNLFSSLAEASFQLGFDGILYTYIPNVISNSLDEQGPVFLKTDSYDDGYIKHYTEASFAECDFTIKRISTGSMAPINWWQEAENKTLNRHEKNIIEVARHDYHLRYGATIPLMSKLSGISGISVICFDHSPTFSQLFEDSLDTLRIIGQLFNDRVLVSERYQACFYLPFLNRLSATQKLVLAGLAQGKHLKKIADETNISYRYSANVVDTLREKFGHVSRERLMYMAGLMHFDELA